MSVLYDPTGWLILGVGIALTLLSTVFYRESFGGPQSRFVSKIAGPLGIITALFYFAYAAGAFEFK